MSNQETETANAETNVLFVLLYTELWEFWSQHRNSLSRGLPAAERRIRLPRIDCSGRKGMKNARIPLSGEDQRALETALQISDAGVPWYASKKEVINRALMYVMVTWPKHWGPIEMPRHVKYLPAEPGDYEERGFPRFGSLWAPKFRNWPRAGAIQSPCGGRP